MCMSVNILNILCNIPTSLCCLWYHVLCFSAYCDETSNAIQLVTVKLEPTESSVSDEVGCALVLLSQFECLLLHAANVHCVALFGSSAVWHPNCQEKDYQTNTLRDQAIQIQNIMRLNK